MDEKCVESYQEGTRVWTSAEQEFHAKHIGGGAPRKYKHRAITQPKIVAALRENGPSLLGAALDDMK